jgi:hypothetical protein
VENAVQFVGQDKQGGPGGWPGSQVCRGRRTLFNFVKKKVFQKVMKK